MSRSLAPLLFGSFLVAGIVVGFVGRTPVEQPTGPPERFVFFDEDGEADFYADQTRRDNIDHAAVITLITVGVVGLMVVLTGRQGHLTPDHT